MDHIARTEQQLGALLRRYRKQADLTQGELGIEVGKRQATVSNIESGAGGTLDTLFTLLNALNLEITVRPRTRGRASDLGDLF